MVTTMVDDSGQELSEAVEIAQEVMGEDLSHLLEGEEAGESTPPPPEPPPVTPPAQPPPPAETPPAEGEAPAPQLTRDDAQSRWAQRQQERVELQRQVDSTTTDLTAAQQERDQLRGIVDSMLRAQQAQKPAQPEDLLPPDPQLQSHLETFQNSILQHIDQRLAPLQQRAEVDQQYSEEQAAESQRREDYNDFLGLVRGAEEDYIQTPEGQGYGERIQGMTDAWRGALQASGVVNQNVVEGLIIKELEGMSFIAMSCGVSPPIFIDNMFRAMAAIGNGTQPNPQPPPQQGDPLQAPQMSEEVRIARQSTLSGAVGDTPSAGSVGTEGRLVQASDLIDRSITNKEIDKLIAVHGGEWMSALADLALGLEEFEPA